jgi:hypothetical protein
MFDWIAADDGGRDSLPHFPSRKRKGSPCSPPPGSTYRTSDGQQVSCIFSYPANVAVSGRASSSRSCAHPTHRSQNTRRQRVVLQPGPRSRNHNELFATPFMHSAVSSPLTDGRTGPGMMITCTSVKRLELHQKLPFRALTTRGTVWFAEHRSRNTAEHFSLLLITIFQVFKLSFSLHSCSNLVFLLKLKAFVLLALVCWGLQKG